MTRVPIAVVGRSCRLPGAPDVEAFWRLLLERRCAVRTIDESRWATQRFLHPRKGEAGKAYTFAAGVLDDVWGFDPTVFSISPREAEQMDPQQRLALQLVWEALEDAGIPPSTLAGTETGVFVGASALDYGSRGIFDPAGIDGYFATGNTLSIISNRVSYAFDLRGPSFTVDTACSSSLVALHEAAVAIDTGRIDTAVVVGVNILLSPVGFISFSQASMLSPRGLCRAFDAGADGYVRAEGGVALVLRRGDTARAAGNRVRARILASGVNSDGRTVGMSLPSMEAQVALLRRVYDEAAIAPDTLAFIEAHGTGTRVGDPAEAVAVGRALAARRTAPLPIGSVKTNVGHLEPAAGLVGLLKAMLALEHNLLPASLHVERLNPEIPFDELKLRVATDAIPLTNGKAIRAAGVNAFGFGGTNAHVVVADPEFDASAAAEVHGVPDGAPPLLAISARSREALSALAGAYGTLLAGKDRATAARIAASVAASRDLLPHRLVVEDRDTSVWPARLAAAAADAASRDVVVEAAIGRDLPVAFVYAGNGSQWAGMGRTFHQTDPVFREQFAEVDAEFGPIGGWSLREALFADDLGARLTRTRVSQPLLLATQIATTAAVRARGIEPVVVFGHSVGEVAAAYAAGAITLRQAVTIIYSRSHLQEAAWKTGTMAAVLMPAEDAHRLIIEGGFEDVEVAAINSHTSITVSGVESQIRAMAKLARARRVPMRILELDYPFHTALIDDIRVPLISELAGLSPVDARVPFVSAVTGASMAGSDLDASYWWHNVRRPVRFADAVAAAIREGARIFLEIGPKPTLQTYLIDGLSAADVAGAACCCSDYRLTEGRDPARHTVAELVAKGAAVDRTRVFGDLRGRPERLPLYQWQNRRFAVTPSAEMQDLLGMRAAHPLLGARNTSDGAEWTAALDSTVVPYLADHKVDGRTIVPAAALGEMALAAGRAWLQSESVELQDFEIIRPLVLGPDALVEVTTRISAESRTIEILSRPRLREEARTLHAYGRFGAIPSRIAPALSASDADTTAVLEPAQLYQLAATHGLEYGPAFQGAERIDTLVDGRIRVLLKRQDRSDLAAGGYGLYPPALDSCFHGLIGLFSAAGRDDGPLVAYLPVRLGEVRLHRPAVPVRSALLTVKRVSERSIAAAFALLDENGDLVASLADCRFRAVAVGRRTLIDRLTYHYGYELLSAPPSAAPAVRSDVALQRAAERAQLTTDAKATRGDADLLLDAFALALAHEALTGVSSKQGRCDVAELVAKRRLPQQRLPLVHRLLTLLRDHGHAEVDGASWRIARDARLPRATAVLRTLVAEHPERSAETVLGARAAALLPRMLHDGTDAGVPYLPSSIAQFAAASPPARRLVDALARVVAAIVAEWPIARPLRILEIEAGAGALTRQLIALLGEKPITLVATDPDAVAAERLRFAFGSHPGVRTQLFDPAIRDATDIGRFDLVVCASPLGAALRDRSSIQRVERAVADDGALAMALLGPTAYADVVFGMDPDWFSRTVVPERPLGRLRTAAEWTAELESARFEHINVASLAGIGEPACLMRAAAARRPVYVDATAASHPDVVIVGTSPDRLPAAALAAAFDAAGRSVRFVDRGHDADPHARAEIASLVTNAQRADGAEPAVVDIVALSGNSLDDAPTDAITTWIEQTLVLARAATDRAARLWVVAPGAFQGATGSGRDCPGASALAGFVRVLVNETRGLDIRVVDPDPQFDVERAAAEVARVVLQSSTEREIVISDKGVCAPRVRRGLPHRDRPAHRGAMRRQGSRLAIGPDGRLDDLAWTTGELPQPQQGEIAVDVAAAGLNFRDVMWAMGLLPEEALEDGFAGPSLGLEAAGIVADVGAGVRRFKPGDRVMTFASGGFASRIVVPEVAAAPLPSTIGFDAGATIPVAFLTAYYGLHHLARLRRGEWVLVHGGAGGVGLAALQIARRRGARTILTAGSDDKRDFLRMLGADHILSSRSLDFVDDVQAITHGRGVDVVLNSLAGEAMERSLRAVRPFGRFLELGKRDYYANTRVGLRPFRQNVSYFGIDADQLLAHRQPLTERLFRDIIRLFEKGVFVPLPFRTFGAGEIRDAFRSMQQSLHVGKIVVAPPPIADTHDHVSPAFSAAGDGTHVVIGGLGGFGLATAEWLVDRGARHLVLVSRSGSPVGESERTLERLRRRAQVKVAACDVADSTALGHLFDEVSQTLPPVKGVVHAAMVLDDALIANLDASRFAAVMRPKIDGAANLDRLTRGLPLDYFVLFSSATTLVGNPGQANYVAANAYLEALARRRRADGLPALAVAWGALADVGYLARKTDVRDKLSRRLGQAALTGREALDALGRLLVETDSRDRTSAALVVAPIDWSAARRELRLLASPAYTQVVADAELSGAGGGDERVDLAALVRGRDAHGARDAVAEVLAGEVSRILKLPLKEVGTQRPLAELGMDSLMGLELQLSAERRLGIELPAFAISDSTTLVSIAAAIVARVQNPEQADDGNADARIEAELIRRHVAEDVSVDDLAEFGEAMRSRQSEIERIV